MPNKGSRPPLWLAVIGLLLYFGLSYLAPLFQDHNDLDGEAQAAPAISKAEAAELAIAFADHKFGLSPGRTADTLFQSNTVRSGYIQKEGLEEEYRKRFEKRYPIDYYEVEIRDGQATYYIGVNFNNRQVISYSASKAPTAKTEARPAAETDASAIAVSAVRDMGFDPAAFTLAGSAADKRPPGEFVFVSKTERIGEAPLELHVQTANGQAVSFRPAFPPPESFTLWQQMQDERSALMTRISLFASLLMALAALILVVRQRKQIDFARGALLSIVFLAIYVSNNYNLMPAFRTMHGSGPSEPDAVLYLWISNIYVALMALSSYFALVAGSRLTLDRGERPWAVWRDADFGGQVKQAMSSGYVIALFILGIQQALFFAATELFDVWAVNDPTDSVYNMLHPEWFPLLAWSAAISEEAVYRVLGVSLMLKLTRRPFVAVLVPSVIWAMSHTQYPVYPVYTRLVEVSVIGIVFGYAYLRYGFLTALFAHAAMDSILMGFSLMYSGDDRQAAVGLAYFFAPAVVGWLLHRLHGRFRPRSPSNPPLRHP
ncbi:CPBP family intramembrane glutamic endopeptidase [Paenibacillus validus]|uniref:CPBP family intramembrane glutamic endopeptidase n=1 Tax=Paenibacillus validus TaxID=44253 RepID=UPI000FDBC09D|nr:type II CAAX endopeptidase family protein [Paenibacillus validus]